MTIGPGCIGIPVESTFAGTIGAGSAAALSAGTGAFGAGAGVSAVAPCFIETDRTSMRGRLFAGLASKGLGDGTISGRGTPRTGFAAEGPGVIVIFQSSNWYV